MRRDVGRTTRDLRRHNRTSVLTRLYLHGPASRFDLMLATGLSSATVSNVVTGLVADGLVAEAGLLDSDGGRPRTLLEVRPGYARVVGVDIGETHVQVGLFDWTLDTLATATFPMDDGGPEPELLAGLVTAGIEEVTAKAGADSAALLGIGVGVPGTVLPDGLVHAPTLGWSGVPFEGLLRPHVAAPLHLDNCARTLGQAEMWRGAGRGAERAIVGLLAVGVGAAVATGSPDGVTSTTSEWGHTVIEAGGAACRCGSHGCLEAYVGAEAILGHYERTPGAPGWPPPASSGRSPPWSTPPPGPARPPTRCTGPPSTWASASPTSSTCSARTASSSPAGSAARSAPPCSPPSATPCAATASPTWPRAPASNSAASATRRWPSARPPSPCTACSRPAADNRRPGRKTAPSDGTAGTARR